MGLCIASTFGFGQGGVVPTMGKEFWVGFMKNYGGGQNSSLDIFISGATNTTGSVTMPLLGWNQNFTVTAGVVTTVTVPIALAMHTTSDLVGDKSILVRTEDTVSVFASNFETHTADAAVVYPTQSLGTDYRMFSFRGLDGWPELTSEFLVVATKDGTEVEIKTTANTVGGQVAGVPWTVQLDSGETYQVKAAQTTGDFTGSTVVGTLNSGSCRPFAVFSGTVCTNIPDVFCTACDHLFEQNLPTTSWGRRYQTVPFSTTTSYMYVILAHFDGTLVTVNGGPPINLSAGQKYSAPNVTGPACIEGNKPIGVAQYMQGITCSANGDPAMLILNAEEQRIQEVTFATIVSNVITDNFLNVIVETTGAGDVELDGNPVPANQFTPFPACGSLSYARLPITQGSHRIYAPTGVTAYVYGMGSAESYAYSVGSFTPVPPLDIDTVLCFDGGGFNVTLAPPEALFDPWWYAMSAPNDTLYEGLSYSFQAAQSDIYVVQGEQFLSGCSQEYLFSIEFDDPPVYTILANGQPDPAFVSACSYEAVVLSAEVSSPGTWFYSWEPATLCEQPDSSTTVAYPLQTQWFKVTVSTLTGCASATDSVLVQLANGAVLDQTVVPDLATVCFGDTTGLELRVLQVIEQDALDVVTGPIWASINGGSISDVCGSLLGDALYFNGAGPRNAATVAFDLSSGGRVRFSLKIATGLAPCDDADAGEDVVLEYSTNGINWFPLATYGQASFPQITQVDFDIPIAAQSPTTSLRWRQLANSGAGQDNWVLDQVVVATYTLAGLTFQWEPASMVSDQFIADPVVELGAQGTWFVVDFYDPISQCNYLDSVFIAVGDPYPVSATKDTVLCLTSEGFVLNVQHNVSSPVYSWSPGFNLNDSTVQSPTVVEDSTATYVVAVDNNLGCPGYDTVHVAVAFSNLTFISDSSLCEGQEMILDAGFPQASHTWSTGETSQSILVDTAGTFVCTMTDDLGCTLSFSTEVTLDPLPRFYLGADTALCVTDTLHLSTGILDTGILGADHLWSNSSIAPSIYTTSSGTFWARVVDGNACTYADTIVVVFNPLPVPLDSNSVSACLNDPPYGKELDARNPGSSYAWSTGDTTRILEAEQYGRYTVLITTPLGCSLQDSVEVLEFCAPAIYVPSSFSPNGDGLNETFAPVGHNLHGYEMEVFDRWGSLVRSSNASSPWDGTMNGQPVPNGVYLFRVTYTLVNDINGGLRTPERVWGYVLLAR
jgi:gliding motility-associated-like protein